MRSKIFNSPLAERPTRRAGTLATELFQRPKLGFLYVLSVPLAAGVATVKEFGVAGINYTGLIWLFFLGVGLLLVFTEKAVHRDRPAAFPWAIWLAWFGWVWLSLLWCDVVDGRAVQDATQITMPLLVGIAASLFVRSEKQLRSLLVCFAVTLLLLILSTTADRVGLFESDPRVMGITAALIGCTFITGWPTRWVGPIAGWAACILLTVATGSRMATLALLLVPILHPGYRSLLVRTTVMLLTAGLGVGLFYTPVLQQRFFYEGSGTLAQLFQGDFLGFGRFDAWPIIWEEAWQRPFLGAGVSSTFRYVPTVWDEMTHVHNDYLKIGFEFGLVGLAIFLLVVLCQIIALKLRMRASQGTLRHAYAAGLLGVLIFLVVAATDNPLVYNLWFMNPLFALIGAAYGVDRYGARREPTAISISSWERRRT